jgi:beta-phosphoglucomutase-like phosphatase (HAD superfamily)
LSPLPILDFDGVVADSEVPANQSLAELLTELGAPTTIEDSYRLFRGKRAADFLPPVAGRLGRPLPEGFVDRYRERTHAALGRDVRLVPGVLAFLDAFAHLPRPYVLP